VAAIIGHRILDDPYLERAALQSIEEFLRNGRESHSADAENRRNGENTG